MINSNLKKTVKESHNVAGRYMRFVAKKKVSFPLAVLIIMFIGGALTMLIWNTASVIDKESGALSYGDLSSADAAAASTLLFNPATTSVGVDQQFTLEAKVNPGTNAVSGVDMRVTYDQTKFRLDSITPSSTFSLELQAASINNTTGNASIALGVPFGTPSVTTTSTVATLSFHSLASTTNSSIAFTTSSLVSADGESGNALATRTPASVTVDATPPTITNITSSHANGSFKAGEVIPVDVTFSKAVTSTGSVTVTLETGTTDRTCAFTVTNSATASCNYTVQAGDGSADLNVNTISGTIKDQSNNAMTNFVPATNLAANKAIAIDTDAPNNQNTVFPVSVSRAGGASVIITSSGDATNNIWFAPAGTTTFLTGATMTKAASGTATSILAPTASGSYKLFVIDAAGNVSAASTATLTIDSVAPTVSSVTSSHANGSFKAGEVIPVSVTFSEAVTSAGNVTVNLETGTTDRSCTFTISNNATGSCDYTVQAGDISPDLTVNTITGTIADQANNAMTNFVPVTNLAANKAIVIDTATPVVTMVSAVPSVVRDSTPFLSFNTTEAGTITYSGDCSSTTTAATSGSNTVTFNTLTTGAHANCSLTVRDAAGNVSSSLSIASFTVTYLSDLNLDRSVDVIDYGVLKTNYGTTNAAGDVNSDGTVNVLDFGILHSEYGSVA
ncbi:MAG: cohesin domain-containing protein [Candidatus Moranbacteria bacterium]|nr:cohesin domain-containing protein [Candidatus Moranbacteria bacterium]